MFNKDKKFLTQKNGVGGFELKICMSCNPGQAEQSATEPMRSKVDEMEKNTDSVFISSTKKSITEEVMRFKACGICPHFQAAVERLGEYEATGLSPKMVKKLAKKGETEAKGKKLPVFDTNDPDCGDKIEKFFEEGKREQ